MTMKQFKHAEVEAFANQYWHSHKTYQKLKERNSSGKTFAFIDGPPYTSGKVHIGTAWNKALKDMVLRTKRMQGLNVYDRAGYDMHGLPTEHATMKKLGLHTTHDIQNYGVDKFIAACQEWCVTNMHEMNKDFADLGVWMDFDNAYQTISPEYINGVWFLIKRAHEQGRLYQGMRSMAWDPVFETACAKHELTYETVTDTSIYVKFPVLRNGERTNEYFLIWTTTPWTIPFNLAIMVHPDVEYVKAKVRGEYWIVAAALVGSAIREAADEEFVVEETMLGKDLEGIEYEHPFKDKLPYFELKKKHPRVHTIVLSSDYVDTESGTGLVHCAPGCGPEDYEVGVRNDIPAYNIVREDGTFPAPFEGWRARTDDKNFIELLEAHGALVAKQQTRHEYAYSERSREPIIYRTTKQWFFKVSDLVEEMIAANNRVLWQPQAGYNAFNSWLENLRDNSITKQRFWGTPVPIWTNETTGEIIVVGSVAELEKLTGLELVDVKHLHKPFIDTLTIKSKKHPGTILKRIPDILDVWVDAGTANWNALDYPKNEELFKTNFPADFILEGKDQIRGWFNLLMIAGMLAFRKPSFKAVYMHGYINDSQGRKMSKSQGNYILPEEVLPKYGVDAYRMYMIGATAPGLDLSYNFEDLTTTNKNLNVLWNTVQYLVGLCGNNGLTPALIKAGDEEEQYILSRMESTTKRVNKALETYLLPDIPHEIETFFLEVSRTYIQLTREKSVGDDKQLVADTLYTVLTRILKMLAPIAPFITEALWQDINNLTGAVGSVHEQQWPEADESLIKPELEQNFSSVQQIITAGLACREQLKQGVRWPLAEIVINTAKPLSQFDSMIKRQVNVKAVNWSTVSSKTEVAPNYGNLGKSFGKETQKIAKLIIDLQPKPPVTVEGYSLLPEHVVIKEHAPDGYAASQFAGGTAYLKTEVTPDLIEEGYVRELMRRIQSFRKELGLEKKDRIRLHVSGTHTLSHNHLEEITRKCNAELVHQHFSEKREEHIRDRTYTISAQKTI